MNFEKAGQIMEMQTLVADLFYAGAQNNGAAVTPHNLISRWRTIPSIAAPSSHLSTNSVLSELED